MHSLAEIINFNIEHPELCLPPSTPVFVAHPISTLTCISMSRPERSTCRPPVSSKTRRNQCRSATPAIRWRTRRSRLPLRIPTTRHHHRSRRRAPFLRCSRSRLPNRRLSSFRPQTQRPTLRLNTRVAPSHRTHTPALPHRLRKSLPAARTPAATLVRTAARRASRAIARSTHHRSDSARMGHAPVQHVGRRAGRLAECKVAQERIRTERGDDLRGVEK
jgi:hypothetical protein